MAFLISMKKKYRIKKSEEFQTIIQHRKYITCSSLVLYYKKKEEEVSRIGISVGKKVGNAVVRNKLKRQLRMMVQEVFTFQEDFDFVLIVREPFSKQNFEENKKDLEILLKKVKMRETKIRV